MVLASQFESLVHPFTVLLAVPLAVTGALFTLKLAGSTLNVYSQIGMILLIGLVSKNSILLVEYINQLKERGMTTLEAAQEAGRIRLRPDPDDLGGHRDGRPADRAGPRSRLAEPASARLCHRGRAGLLHPAHALCGARGLRDLRRGARTVAAAESRQLTALSRRRRRTDAPLAACAPGHGGAPGRRRAGGFGSPDYPGRSHSPVGSARPRLRQARWGKSRTPSGAGGQRCWPSSFRRSNSVWTKPSIPSSFFNPANPANPTSTLVVGRATRQLRGVQPPQVF